MSNRLAILLGGTILGLIVLDLVILRGQALLFLLRKLFDMIEWAAFWR